MPAATRCRTDIPLASTGVWNIGIGSNALWSLGTDVNVGQLYGLYGAVTTAIWGRPIHFATASDPLVTVTNIDTIIPAPPQRLHSPINALPAAGSGGYVESHMSFHAVLESEDLVSDISLYRRLSYKTSRTHTDMQFANGPQDATRIGTNEHVRSRSMMKRGATRCMAGTVVF